MDILEFVQYLQVMDSFITLAAFATLLGLIGYSYPEVYTVTRRIALVTNRFCRGVIGPARKRHPNIGR